MWLRAPIPASATTIELHHSRIAYGSARQHTSIDHGTISSGDAAMVGSGDTRARARIQSICTSLVTR